MTPTLPTEWNLEQLRPAGTSLNSAMDPIEAAARQFNQTWEPRAEWLADPHALAQALEAYNAFYEQSGEYGPVGYAVLLRHYLDQAGTVAKAEWSELQERTTATETLLQFFHLRLGKIPVETQKTLLAAPELAPYAPFLRSCFKKGKHQLSEPEETILNLKQQGAKQRWVDLTKEFLGQETRLALREDGSHSEATLDELLDLSHSTQKKVRDLAAAQINEITAKLAPLATAELNAILSDKKINDELRHFDRPDASRHLSDGIDTESVDAMLVAVEKHFDIAQRFYTLKAKLLGVEQLAYHERNVPVGENLRSYSYPEAHELVQQVLGKLDPEFSATLAKTAQGQTDVYPKAGKRGGAACISMIRTLPSFVILNFSGKLSDVLTLAHETGHNINNDLIARTQLALYFEVALSTAEVASTFFEDFVLEELLAEAKGAERLSLLVSKMDRDISTIFRQSACYRFEQELHQQFRQKHHLATEDINQLFQKHMAAYMGPSVEQSPGSEYWWVYWQHIRRYFYVFSYASGMLISKALQAMVRADQANLAKVKTFLSTGTSATPRDIFAAMGVDITDPKFWEDGLKLVDSQLSEIDELCRNV